MLIASSVPGTGTARVSKLSVCVLGESDGRLVVEWGGERSVGRNINSEQASRGLLTSLLGKRSPLTCRVSNPKDGSILVRPVP